MPVTLGKLRVFRHGNNAWRERFPRQIRTTVGTEAADEVTFCECDVTTGQAFDFSCAKNDGVGINGTVNATSVERVFAPLPSGDAMMAHMSKQQSQSPAGVIASDADGARGRASNTSANATANGT